MFQHGLKSTFLMCLKSLGREKEITCKIFHTVYKIAKNNHLIILKIKSTGKNLLNFICGRDFILNKSLY